ncbi:MAG: hypothetical protein EAX96_07635 [Candidatus Lokiarchaeota archaeon]|nr:hypothetical protein [Candidatus Lokiarchaeota archaeon]
MSKKSLKLLFFTLLLLFLIPNFQTSINATSDNNFNLTILDQTSANLRIIEAETAIQNAYLKLTIAETLFIDINSLSNMLENAITILNLAYEMNNSQNPNFAYVEGNATLAKNIANDISSEVTQLISYTQIINLIIIIIVIVLIGSVIAILSLIYIKKIKKKSEKDFLESVVIKKEEKS